MTTILLSLLLTCSSFAAPPAAELKELAAQGFVPARIITDEKAGLPLTAIILHSEKKGLDQLTVYAEIKGRFIRIYSHPGSADRLEFDPSMLSDRGFPDLLRDKSRVIAYRSAAPGLGRTLNILRAQGLRMRRAGSFPEGDIRDIDGDGRPEVVARSLPLGRFLSMGCDDFSTLSQSAFQTQLYSWKAGRFADVSAQFPAFFAADIARLEETLALIPKEKRPGEYLGGALSVYYDYAAQGERRRGWDRLSSLLQPPPYAMARVTDCIGQVQAELRRGLSIPPDWK